MTNWSILDWLTRKKEEEYSPEDEHEVDPDDVDIDGHIMTELEERRIQKEIVDERAQEILREMAEQKLRDMDLAELERIEEMKAAKQNWRTNAKSKDRRRSISKEVRRAQNESKGPDVQEKKGA